MRLLALPLLLALAACGKTETPPAAGTPAETAASAAEDSLAPMAQPMTEADAGAEPAALSVAVNEPLPPFEDGSGIVLAARGSFQALDKDLPVSGEMYLYEAPDGSRLLRLENLQSSKDLRLDVALSRNAAPASATDALDAALIGALKGPSGNMNYLLPRGTDLSAIRAIALVEHGQPRVLAYATLARPS